MTEVTRVPLQPIAKGSLTKIWLGVVIAILLGAGLAWAATPKGFSVDTLVEGEGPSPSEGDHVFVKYTGRLASNGEVFDEYEELPPGIREQVLAIFPDGMPFQIAEGATIEGFNRALQQMQKGGKYEVYIPSDMAYGDEPRPGGPIPPGADLVFEIEVVDFLTDQEYQTGMMVLQQAMQAQMGGLGAPGGPEGAPPPPVEIPAQ